MLIESDRNSLAGRETTPVQGHRERGAAGEYHCASCGYGIAVRSPLPLCPMCGGPDWDPGAFSAHHRAGALPVD